MSGEPSEDQVVRRLWHNASIVRNQVIKDLKSKDGVRTAKQSGLAMVQIVWRMGWMLLAAGFLHWWLGHYNWYAQVSHDSVIAASVLQGLFGLVALFGAYFLFNRTQVIGVVDRFLKQTDVWQAEVDSAKPAHAGDEAWLKAAKEFDERAVKIRRNAHTFTIGGDFDYKGARELQKNAPAPFNENRPAWEFEFELIANAFLRRVAAHIPMYKATVVALTALAGLAIPAWNTGGLTLVLFAQTWVVGYQVVIFFARN